MTIFIEDIKMVQCGVNWCMRSLYGNNVKCALIDSDQRSNVH